MTSQYAEVIYFLRNGNLYRRVLLIAPERQGSITDFTTANGSTGSLQSLYVPSALATNASWYAVNDISARPTNVGALTGTRTDIKLNTMGDLTNRENRWSYPRFCNDYVTHGIPGTIAPDGQVDDENAATIGTTVLYGDGAPDYYPTLYGPVFGATNSVAGVANPRVWDFYPLGSNNAVPAQRIPSYDTMAFPYIFPGSYSKPDPNTRGFGLIHTPNPILWSASLNKTYLSYLQTLNHAPIDVGDSLPFPQATETWWGLPTWRESLSPYWNDPFWPLYLQDPLTGKQPSQPRGLGPVNPANYVFSNFDILPPMTAQYRPVPQPNVDGAGSIVFAAAPANPPTAIGPIWAQSWEDDLIMPGVRSFDIKAYDNALPGYVDLGWGDDLRLYAPYINQNTLSAAGPPFMTMTPGAPNTNTTVFQWPPIAGSPTYGYNSFTFPNGTEADPTNVINHTFAHEGRIPPLYNDWRYDPQFLKSGVSLLSIKATFPQYDWNIGDDQNTVIRLRRTWDSWSTEYTQAWSKGYDPNTAAAAGLPLGPPIYTSYPPPYPAPMRGLQIQIRVVDPRNERVKVLTIRRDFSDKLAPPDGSGNQQ